MPVRLELKIHLPGVSARDAAGVSRTDSRTDTDSGSGGGVGGARSGAVGASAEGAREARAALVVAVSSGDVELTVPGKFHLQLELPHKVDSVAEDACFDAERWSVLPARTRWHLARDGVSRCLSSLPLSHAR